MKESPKRKRTTEESSLYLLRILFSFLILRSWKVEITIPSVSKVIQDQHEDDAFSGDGSGTRLTFRREAPSWLSRSEFKNRLSLEINKSRSSGGCEIRQASVPPPLLSNQGNALPLSLHIY